MGRSTCSCSLLVARLVLRCLRQPWEGHCSQPYLPRATYHFDNTNHRILAHAMSLLPSVGTLAELARKRQPAQAADTRDEADSTR